MNISVHNLRDISHQSTSIWQTDLRIPAYKPIFAQNHTNGSAQMKHKSIENPTSANLISGLILGLHAANERRRYFVTSSLIGWAQT